MHRSWNWSAHRALRIVRGSPGQESGSGAPKTVARHESSWRLARSLLSAVCLVLVLLGCSGLAGVRDDAPTASLEVEPESGEVPLEVIVDTTGSGFEDDREVTRELSVNGGEYEPIEALHGLRITAPGSHLLALRVTAANGKSASAEVTVTARPGTAEGSDFQLQVTYPDGEWQTAERQALEYAAERWSEVIVGDLPDVAVNSRQVERACGAGYRYSGTIDDILLFASVREIDGPGGVVGMAGSCLLRSDGFPLAGVILLDSEDIDFLSSSGNLATVLLHELGHVLDLNQGGWNRRELLRHDRSRCLDSTLVEFTGSESASEYWNLGGSGRVPVEDNGVLGTACSHWDEETFRSELMTGYLDSHSRLSRITVAALSDMGYRVNLEAADSYVLPEAGTLRPQGAGIQVSERLIQVGGIMGDDGVLQPLPAGDPVDIELELPAGPHGH